MNTAGAVPPSVPARRASSTAGNASVSSGSKVHEAAAVQSTGAAAPGTRSGQVSPRAIGSFMSGGEHWAISAPSTYCTAEWTIDCGCTTTWIRDRSTSYSSPASISSSPLLTSVAELMVITGPICQVGWAIACAGVTSMSSARVHPRKGPPDAVSTSLSTSSARPARRHWAKAECSESTATSCPGAAASVTSRPPITRDSLLARARVVPARRAARVGSNPTDPVIPFSTTSAGSAASSVAASAPAMIRGNRTSPRFQPRFWASA
ncbi:hypothetical protein SDC9_136822 [bioreactor metagenome]|uniref:Uncharacterized protein n=1 Tax=bioreactor metagenome TaxID=1076179 RepID=A0A645DJU8_9ZZZZ